MKLIIAAIIVSIAFATLHPVNHDIVERIKNMPTTWTPMEADENPFAYMSIEEIKSMMGTKLNPTHNMIVDYGVTPNDSFDAREKWTDKIHPIRTQGICGSCWAFGAAGALSDRLAIAGADVILSPQYLVSCDQSNFGCTGGDLFKAWQFMEFYGIVTETCYPYISSGGFAGFCKSKCSDGSDFKRYFSGSVVETANIDTIKQAIMTGGPVEASFIVYSDFMNYKEGIYQHTGEGEVLGGHAVKAIGWGTENNVDYWIMANSWGPKWGDKGYFKIKQGDCKIDEEVVFADAKLSSD